MGIAVALTDHAGDLIGICHNPQPIWRLARKAKSEWGAGCLFCLNSGRGPSGSCTAAADALQTGSMVLTHDYAGFAHVALPLALGDRHFGMLLAGQVFDHYPEPLALERAAKDLGLSAQGFWNIARLQVPVSGSNLRVYGSLLLTLGRAVLDQSYGRVLKRRLAASDAKLQSANQELEQANSNLRDKVAALDKSNGEKDVLLQEVHHRVNNNLQVIASLLRLQAEFAENHQVADALRTSQMRIESMALIHAQLYGADDLRQVDFAEYTARLANNFLVSYGVDRARIGLSVELGGLKLPVDQAIPAGLILGELISNALKYAFPEPRRGSIRIEGGRSGDRIELVMRDDGVGIAQLADAQRRKPRGLKIIATLCRQLRGTLEQTQGAGEPGPGVVFRISFPNQVPDGDPSSS